MKKLLHRLPRGLRLGLGLALALLLLTGFWLLQGRPCLSPEAAFRQGLRNAALPVAASEITLPQTDPSQDWNWEEYRLGTDGARIFGLGVYSRSSELLSFLRMWKPRAGVSCRSMKEGVGLLPLRSYAYGLQPVLRWEMSAEPENRLWMSTELQNLQDCLIVKAPGARVELSLVLEDGTADLDPQLRKGGVYGLEGESLGKGWYRFRFRSCYLPQSIGPAGPEWKEYESLRESLPPWEPDLEAAWAYYEWVRLYCDNRPSDYQLQNGYFEVRVCDERGAVLQNTRIEP